MATVFILGSHDVEMVCIRELLEEAGFLCLQAGNMVTLPNGVQTFVPVAPGQSGTIIARITFDGAYDVVPMNEMDMYLGVEVAGPWGPAAFDHHDNHPNASLPPSEFLRASSLGQVILWLYLWRRLPDSWTSGHGALYKDAFYIHPEMGVWCIGGDRHSYAIAIPPRYVAQAAADHCIAAAFAGQCPGVDLTPGSPTYNEVVLSRRQAFAPGMSEDEFLAAVEVAKKTLLRRAGVPWVDGVLRSSVPAFPHFADLTDYNPWMGPIATTGEQYPINAQFLPLVGSMLGIGYIVPILKYIQVDGKWANPVGAYRLGGCGVGTTAGTAPVEWWANEGWEIMGCHGPDAPRPNNMYANPARGFGGGTVK